MKWKEQGHLGVTAFFASPKKKVKFKVLRELFWWFRGVNSKNLPSDSWSAIVDSPLLALQNKCGTIFQFPEMKQLAKFAKDLVVMWTSVISHSSGIWCTFGGARARSTTTDLWISSNFVRWLCGGGLFFFVWKPSQLVRRPTSGFEKSVDIWSGERTFSVWIAKKTYSEGSVQSCC